MPIPTLSLSLNPIVSRTNTVASDQDEGKNAPAVNDETLGLGWSSKPLKRFMAFITSMLGEQEIRKSWYSLDDVQCSKFMLTCCKEGKREYKNSERCSS